MKDRPVLPLDETAKLLAKLREGINKDMIAETRSGIESGAPDEILVRRLLAEFVHRARAPSLRKHLGPYSNTPDVMEFLASRVDAFLSGSQPDLMKAFGLTMPRRGRKPASDVRKRQQVVAAEVLDLMEHGKTLDDACSIVAEVRSLSESTVRNWYSWHKQTAANLLVYRYTLHSSFAAPDGE